MASTQMHTGAETTGIALHYLCSSNLLLSMHMYADTAAAAAASTLCAQTLLLLLLLLQARCARLTMADLPATVSNCCT
jgi:hypothetical protein